MFVNPKLKISDLSSSKTNFFCDICKFPLTSMDDFEKDEKYSCCYECYQTYAESRLKEWKEGWRPDKTQLEEYIYLRKQMYSKIIRLTEK